MFRSLIRFAGLCLAVSSLHGQVPSGFIPVSGNIVDLTGVPLVGSAQLCAQSVVGAVGASQLVAGVGQTTSRQVCKPINSVGAFTINLPNTFLALPHNLCISITATDSTGRQLLGPGYGCVQPTSDPASTWCTPSGCNLNLYQPNLAPAALQQYGPKGDPGTGVVVGPGGVAGNWAVTGELTAGNINGVVQAQPGDTVAAAVTRCPASGSCVVALSNTSYPAGVPITHDNLWIVGMGPAAYPAANDDSAFIAGTGTIISGSLALTGNNITVEKLSLDVGSSGGNCNVTTDALALNAVQGITGTPYQNVEVRDVRVLLCDAHGVHSLLATATNHLILENIETRHGLYGPAIFGTNIKVDGLWSQNNTNPFIVKSTNSGVTIATAEVDISNTHCEKGGISNVFALGTSLTDVSMRGIHMTGCGGLLLNTASPGLLSHAVLDGIFEQGFVGSNPTTCSSGIQVQGAVDNLSIENAHLDGCSYAGIVTDASTGTVSIAHADFTDMVGKPIISSSAALYLDDVGFGTASAPINDYPVTAAAGKVFVKTVHGFTAQSSFFNPGSAGVISPYVYPGDTYAIGYSHLLNVNMGAGTAGEPRWAANPFVAGMLDHNNGTTAPGASRFQYGPGLNYGITAATAANCATGGFTGQVLGIFREYFEAGQGCIVAISHAGDIALTHDLYVSNFSHLGMAGLLTSAPGYSCNGSAPLLPLGSLNYIAGASGTADTLQYCSANADGTSSWKPFGSTFAPVTPALSGTRFACVNTAGQLVSQTTACSGT